MWTVSRARAQAAPPTGDAYPEPLHQLHTPEKLNSFLYFNVPTQQLQEKITEYAQENKIQKHKRK
jgi:hypothetical protein